MMIDHVMETQALKRYRYKNEPCVGMYGFLHRDLLLELGRERICDDIEHAFSMATAAVDTAVFQVFSGHTTEVALVEVMEDPSCFSEIEYAWISTQVPLIIQRYFSSP
jgi:hypothetical protein